MKCQEQKKTQHKLAYKTQQSECLQGQEDLRGVGGTGQDWPSLPAPPRPLTLTRWANPPYTTTHWMAPRLPVEGATSKLKLIKFEVKSRLYKIGCCMAGHLGPVCCCCSPPIYLLIISIPWIPG